MLASEPPFIDMQSPTIVDAKRLGTCLQCSKLPADQKASFQMNLTPLPISFVPGSTEECLRLKPSFGVVDIPLRPMSGAWTASANCNYGEGQMHLRRLEKMSTTRPLIAPAPSSRLNLEALNHGYDATIASTTVHVASDFGTTSSSSSFYRQRT